MGEIGVSELGKTLNSNKDAGELTPYLCSINIHWTCINLEEVKKTKFTKEEQRKYILLKNDLLVCEGGDIGRCFIWDLPIPMYYQNALHRIRFYNEINPFFFKFAIEYYKNIHILDKYSKGVTIKHLTKTALHSICFPLPPLSEQRRIVEKIEELLALVDDLETNKTDLQSYIKQAKSKVLEMAVRGELVPQNPEDEPASALLEHIKKEQKSSKSKGKTTEHNTHYEEELSFNIPENWVWCRLGEVYDLLNGFAFKSNDYIEFSNTLVFRMSQIRPGGGIDFDNNPKYVSDEFATSKKEFLLKEGDVVIAMTDMATDTKILGVPTQIPYDKRNWLLNQRVGKLFQKEKNILDPTFLKNVLISDFMNKYYKTFGKGGVQINIGKQDILNAKIPLPPLAEQHRIVEKIEHIFAVLEELEENIL